MRPLLEHLVSSEKWQSHQMGRGKAGWGGHPCSLSSGREAGTPAREAHSHSSVQEQLAM